MSGTRRKLACIPTIKLWAKVRKDEYLYGCAHHEQPIHHSAFWPHEIEHWDDIFACAALEGDEGQYVLYSAVLKHLPGTTLDTHPKKE